MFWGTTAFEECEVDGWHLSDAELQACSWCSIGHTGMGKGRPEVATVMREIPFDCDEPDGDNQSVSIAPCYGTHRADGFPADFGPADECYYWLGQDEDPETYLWWWLNERAPVARNNAPALAALAVLAGVNIDSTAIDRTPTVPFREVTAEDIARATTLHPDPEPHRYADDRTDIEPRHAAHPEVLLAGILDDFRVAYDPALVHRRLHIDYDGSVAEQVGYAVRDARRDVFHDVVAELGVSLTQGIDDARVRALYGAAGGEPAIGLTDSEAARAAVLRHRYFTMLHWADRAPSPDGMAGARGVPLPDSSIAHPPERALEYMARLIASGVDVATARQLATRVVLENGFGHLKLHLLGWDARIDKCWEEALRRLRDDRDAHLFMEVMTRSDRGWWDAPGAEAWWEQEPEEETASEPEPARDPVLAAVDRLVSRSDLIGFAPIERRENGTVELVGWALSSAARARLDEMLRAHGIGEDFFSEFCRATHDAWRARDREESARRRANLEARLAARREEVE